MNSRWIASAWVPLLVASLAAQQAPPRAPELQRLDPFVGNWHGEGDATFGPGAEPIAWTGDGTCKWVLGGHWLQEEFCIRFAGGPAAQHRAYLGWDQERRRYVKLSATSAGEVALRELHAAPGGAFVEFAELRVGDQVVLQRSRLEGGDEALVHTIDHLAADGASTTVIAARFERGDHEFACDGDAAAAPSAVVTDMLRRLGRSVGTYEVTAEVVPEPGATKVKIGGTDVLRALFGGTVLVGVSTGAPEGAPAGYEGHVIWGADAAKRALVAGYVGNHGELMFMDARFLADGRLALQGSTTIGAQPRLERMLIEFDQGGAMTRASGDIMIGDSPPFANYVATYRRK